MITITPWGKAEDAVDRAAAQPSLETLRAARTSLDALAGLQSVPGVKKKTIELEGRFLAVRNKHFDELIAASDLAGARNLHEHFRVDSASVEETVRIAALALAQGVKPPDLKSISHAEVRWELRPIFYEARYNETVESDPAEAREALSLWIQHDPQVPAPHLLLLSSLISSGQTEEAVAHLAALHHPLQDTVLAGIINDQALSPHLRSYVLIRLGHVSQAAIILDEILAANPADEWAIAERIKIAEGLADTATSRALYAKWHSIRPDDPTIVRREAELALAEHDITNASTKFHAAWNFGDIDAGLSAARLDLNSGADIYSLLDDLSPRIASAEQAMTLGDLFLNIRATEKASNEFRKAIAWNRLKADDVIGIANSWVNANKDGRLPLLQLLCDVGPTRGYPADPYQLMIAEDFIDGGRGREARPLLENLLETPHRWKAFALLSRMAMEEAPGAKRMMAERLEENLAEAKKSSRGTWAELKYHSAMLSEAAGDTDEATKKYEELNAHEFGFRDAAERIERLRNRHAHEPSVDGPRFELLERIGSAEDRALFIARDRLLGKTVALKALEGAGDGTVERVREAAKVAHPNLAEIIEVARNDGKWFVAYENLAGPRLRDRLASGPLRGQTAVEIMHALFSALSALHARGIFHGSLHAGNVVFTSDEISVANMKLKDTALASSDATTDIRDLGLLGTELLGETSPVIEKMTRGDYASIDDAHEEFRSSLI